jgi:hypothetical protein
MQLQSALTTSASYKASVRQLLNSRLGSLGNSCTFVSMFQWLLTAFHFLHVCCDPDWQIFCVDVSAYLWRPMVDCSGSTAILFSFRGHHPKKLMSGKIQKHNLIKTKLPLISLCGISVQLSTMGLKSRDREAEGPELLASHKTISSRGRRKDQRWESHRDEIYELYMARNNTLKKTMQIIQEKYGFAPR